MDCRILDEMVQSMPKDAVCVVNLICGGPWIGIVRTCDGRRDRSYFLDTFGVNSAEPIPMAAGDISSIEVLPESHHLSHLFMEVVGRRRDLREREEELRKIIGTGKNTG
jgi:hypothetical protein